MAKSSWFPVGSSAPSRVSVRVPPRPTKLILAPSPRRPGFPALAFAYSLTSSCSPRKTRVFMLARLLDITSIWLRRADWRDRTMRDGFSIAWVRARSLVALCRQRGPPAMASGFAEAVPETTLFVYSYLASDTAGEGAPHGAPRRKITGGKCAAPARP